MELRSIQSPVVSSIPAKSFTESQQFVCYRQLIKSFGTRRIVQSNSIKLRPVRFNVQASATISSQPAETKTKDVEEDGNLIFVAGATGKVGSRTVRELLKLGFHVKAGVRSIQRAEPLVESVKQMKLDGSQPIEKLELVECDLEKPEQIKPALGKASTVICCIGASEKEVLDVTGPYRIDFQATKNLIDAATAAKAKHFILVTSLGTNKFGFPAAILNLFWGVLCWKRKAEEALLASGIPYTIVRPGGMERPTDAYKETHNLTLSTEDTLFGGQVSNLQVAELLAFMAQNPTLSYCKVVEVVAETTAPLTPMADLLTKIPPQRAIPSPPKPKEPEAVKVPEPVKTTSTSEISSSSVVTEIKTAVTAPPKPRPLSPYTMYEGLKPPVSPIPTAPGGSKVVVEAVATTSTETVSVIAEPEPVVVEVPKTRPLSPYTMYEGLKPPVSPIPTAPGGSKAVIEAVSTIPTESETITEVETVAITTEPEIEPVVVELQKTSPLSPYTAYENLKPPTSPIPTPSGSQQPPPPPSTPPPPPPPQISSESTTILFKFDKTEDVIEVKEDVPPPTAATNNGSPVAPSPETTPEITPVNPRPLSPYSMYESLKPPTSPIPSTPSGSPPPPPPPPTAATNNGSPVAPSPENTPEITPVNPRPLSPYAMYESLKPPTSPIPSTPK